MGIFKTVTEGGQIWAHRVRMAKQVIKITSSVSILFAALFFAYRLSQIPTLHYQALFYHLKTTLSIPGDTIAVSSKFWWIATHQSTAKDPLLISPETVSKVCKRYVVLLEKQLSKDIAASITLAMYVFGSSLFFFLWRGWRARRKQHVEGREFVSNRKLALRLFFSRRASRIKLGSVPLVKGSETHHILVSGATGTGKTNTFHSLLPQIRKYKQRAIVVDITGEFVEKYYDKDKDILLNPFDKRSAPWHPWCECSDSCDYKSLAQSFIPSSYREEENFWRKGAQEVLFSALKETSVSNKTSYLSKLLLHDPLTTLATILKGTTATAYLDMSSEKTAGSIRAVVSSFLECLELIPDTQTPFSIKKWVSQEEQDSWLFLTCTPQQRASLIPLLSTWLSIGISSLLQLDRNPNRRLWFVIDELPRLSRLKDLEPFLTESRKFGGCGLLAIQSPSQLENIYGRETTNTILGNCATRVAFAEYDAVIADLISRGFGNKEVRESQEALSYGSHEMRDGINLSYQTKTIPVVTATALQSLSTFEAFAKLPGNLPITKIKLKYQQTPKLSEPFIRK